MKKIVILATVFLLVISLCSCAERMASADEAQRPGGDEKLTDEQIAMEETAEPADDQVEYSNGDESTTDDELIFSGYTDSEGKPAKETVGNMPWRLDDKFMDYFSIYGNVGVTFNVGSCALDLGVEVGYSAEAKKTAIAVPFSVQVAF